MKTKPLTTLITTNARIILYYKHAEQTWRDPQGLKQMLVLEKYQNLNSSKQYSRRLGHSIVSLYLTHVVVYLRHLIKCLKYATGRYNVPPHVCEIL